MVLLQLFLLGALDEAINPPKKRTIAKRVRIGLTDREFKNLTTPFQPKPRRVKQRNNDFLIGFGGQSSNRRSKRR